MAQPKGNGCENEGNEYLSRVSAQYFLDASSGLYKPRTGPQDGERQNAGRPKKKNIWFPIEVRTDWALFVCTLATLVVVSLYTWINGQMWNEMKISAEASIEAARAATDAIRIGQANFQREQRPYVFINADKPAQFPVQDGTNRVQIVWTYHLRDFGKTPALNVVEHSWIRLGDGPYKTGYSPIAIKRYPSHLGQNDDHFSTVVSEPIRREESDRLMSTDSLITIKVQVEYKDLFGVRFSTRECFSHLALGSTEICEGGYVD